MLKGNPKIIVSKVTPIRFLYEKANWCDFRNELDRNLFDDFQVSDLNELILLIETVYTKRLHCLKMASHNKEPNLLDF